MTKTANTLLVILLLAFSLVAQNALAAGETGPLIYDQKTFQAGIGEIATDKEGKTTVEILTDLEVLAGANDGIAPMFAVSSTVKVKIIAGGKTYESKLFEVKEGGLVSKGKQGDMYVIAVDHIVYHFETSAKPDKIIVYNAVGTNITFDGKTKQVIE